MTPLERHKSRILATIRANETRKLRIEPRPRKWKRYYPRKRVRFDTPNIGEMT